MFNTMLIVKRNIVSVIEVNCAHTKSFSITNYYQVVGFG